MGCWCSKTLAVLAALLLPLAASQASAAPPVPIELSWEAPSGCPPAARVLREVARLVGESERQVQARAVVEREAGARFRVQIELSGAATGKRTLTADSCDSAARATGLIIALAIDPQAATVVSDQIEQAADRAEQTPVAAREAPAPRPPTTPAGRVEAERLRGLLFSGVVAEQALLPGLAVGAVAGGGLHLSWLRADLSCSFVPAASATAASAPSRGADFASGAVTLRLCPGLVDTAVDLYACAGLRATRVWAEGTGVPEPVAAYGDILSAALAAILRWPGDSTWAAELDANLVVPFSRPEFVIENVGRVYQPPVVGASGAIALGYRF